MLPCAAQPAPVIIVPRPSDIPVSDSAAVATGQASTPLERLRARPTGGVAVGVDDPDLSALRRRVLAEQDRAAPRGRSRPSASAPAPCGRSRGAQSSAWRRPRRHPRPTARRRARWGTCSGPRRPSRPSWCPRRRWRTSRRAGLRPRWSRPRTGPLRRWRPAPLARALGERRSRAGRSVGIGVEAGSPILHAMSAVARRLFVLLALLAVSLTAGASRAAARRSRSRASTTAAAATGTPATRCRR